MNKKQFSGQGKYDRNMKIAVVREYQTGQMSYGQLAEKYGLPGKDTVAHFVRWYQQRYPAGVTEDPGGTKTANIQVPKELMEANLKITALQLLIENAGKELGVDLIKKFGTKQSPK